MLNLSLTIRIVLPSLIGLLRGGVAQWVARLTRNYLNVVGSSPIKGPRCFLEQETYLVLVGSRIGFERDFIIKLK